jgi:peptidoglycan hydrolase CwlO-like protein
MKAKMDYGLEILVRMLYLEPALAQRRLLVLGRDAGQMAPALERMGAAHVRTHAPDEGRSLPWDLGGLRGKRDADLGSSLPVRRGEVDIVFIPDLAEVQDYRALLGETARVLDRHGLLVLSVRNAECTVPVSETGLEEWPEVWSLDSLEQLLGQYFTHVELVGQSPFLGYAMASYDPARGRRGVRLDTSLMRSQGEDPEFMVAVCGHESPAEPLSNALFQVPLAEMALVRGEAPERAAGESEPEGRLRAELESLKRELGNRNVVVSRLEKEIEKLEGEAEAERQRMFDLRQKMERERKGQQKEALESVMRKEVDKTPETWLAERSTLTRELEEQKKLRSRAEKHLTDVQKELQRVESRARQLESRERDSRRRMERSEDKAKELRVQVKQLEARLREEETRIPEMGRRIDELSRSLDAAENRADRLERERAELESEKARLEERRGDERELEESRRELERTSDRCRKLEARLERMQASLEEYERELSRASEAPREQDDEVAGLKAELERREELVRDLIHELEVLPAIVEERRGADDTETHRLVGEVERLQGENEELRRTAARRTAEAGELRRRLEKAERESQEAAAVVSLVDDALGAGQSGAAPPPDASLDRFLADLQQELRRIAADPGATAVARDIGELWLLIENKRRAR